MLVKQLSGQLGRTVLDQTGLTANYDFTLRWTPDQPDCDALRGPSKRAGRDRYHTPESSGPSIFTAIQEQLGLKLEPKTAPVAMLVIDHVEMPAEN